MRKLGIIAATLALTVLFQTAACFAGTLEIVDSYPRDGGTGLQPVNCAVKLYFNQEISSEDIMVNSERFTFKDAEGNVLPLRVLNNPKDKTMVLVIVENDLESDTEYSLTISGDFVLINNATLESDKTITFKTRNLGSDTNSMMVLMIVMFAAMLFFTSRQMKRQAQKEKEEGGKAGKVNPYKVSKETGKSVEEVVKKAEKARQKRAAEEARYKPMKKKKTKSTEEDFDYEEYESLDYESYELDNDNKRVKGPRPISAAGSTYRSGKKAKAEAEARRKAKEMATAKASGTTRPKHQSGKAKNKKR